MDVEFYIEAVEDRTASQAAGRPVYVNRERVRLTMPHGGAVVQDLGEHHARRFPDEYRAFRAAQNATVAVGRTPLADWPAVDVALLEELRRRGFAAVEDIAELTNDEAMLLPDDHPGSGGAIMLRDRARAFVDAGDREELVARLIRENEGLRLANAHLEHRNAALVEQIGRMESWALMPPTVSAPLPALAAGGGRPLPGLPFGAGPEMSSRSALDALPAPRRRPRPLAEDGERRSDFQLERPVEGNDRSGFDRPIATPGEVAPAATEAAP